MCWIGIDFETKIKVAKDNIPVTKVVIINHNKIKSYYEGFEYSIGKTYKTKLDLPSQNSIACYGQRSWSIYERWRDNENALIDGYFIDNKSNINIIPLGAYNTKENYNIFATERQAKSALAMARISQIMANDKRFGGAITDEEWHSTETKYVMERFINTIDLTRYAGCYQFLAFHTAEQRALFLEENEDLVKDYLML